MLIGSSFIRRVTGISPAQEQRVQDFLQGAVYCWCKTRGNQWFSCRKLIGAESDWEGTALHELYLKNKKQGRSNPYGKAAIDAGWLLKSVLVVDRKWFDQGETKNGVKRYRWNGKMRRHAYVGRKR